MAKAKSTTVERSRSERCLVRVTVDHIYLPLDACGDVPLDWQEAAETVRVDGGAQLRMPRCLIAGLTGRVEIV